MISPPHSSYGHSYGHDYTPRSGLRVHEGETGIPPMNYEEQSHYQGVKRLLSNKFYLFLTISASCLYFVITGLQFWVTDYLIVVLKLPESQAFASFAVI